MKSSYSCKAYEAKLEDLLNGVASSATSDELNAHLQDCPACREAFEAATFGRELLREALRPVPEPHSAFATRVIGAIRAEESRRQQFWRPLEALASRLALTAAAALLLLGAYVYEVAPSAKRGSVATQAEVTDGFPQPAKQPATDDEVLLTLAGSNVSLKGNSNGR